MQVALLAEPKTPLESSVFYYEHSGGVGQDHVCAIIADSLMSTTNEMCGAFFVHTMKHCCIRTREITSVVYGRNAEN